MKYISLFNAAFLLLLCASFWLKAWLLEQKKVFDGP